MARLRKVGAVAAADDDGIHGCIMLCLVCDGDGDEDVHGVDQVVAERNLYI